MASVQDTYSERQRPAVEGMPGDMVPSSYISRSVQNDEGIAFGKMVAQHATIDGGCVPYADGLKYLGIATRERGVLVGSIEGFPKYESARIKTKGTIWVKVTANVKAGDDIYGGAAGFTNTAGTGLIKIPGQFDTSASSGGLAKIRLA